MNPTEECANHFIKYEDFQKFSEVYYAYSFVHKYIEEPFLTLMPGVNYEELVFNSCRFVINTILSQSSAGINKIYLYYAFGKLA